MADGPRSFPPMYTMKQAREIARLSARAGHPRTFTQCRCCGLAVNPRNRARHFKACQRRKRDTPQLWREWQADMYGWADDDKRRPSVYLTLDQAEHTLIRNRITERNT